VHVKSLTLRGFKSFASATTLCFEPGITCIVGPNGSGKSNVVDALTWVMGKQGAKSLRGGTMEDVIFAGTAGRPPLGRAEVTLTIDNTDGALPIAYSEVTISRIMFRNGGSEYAINGTTCRLLDIQELLSDSGIGQAMHVVIGQGQLDAILLATSEERRGFIEEAAGVLKHRKRKEKALRKLDATRTNLIRLTDLTAELRRQLKPLGKQAEAARRATVTQARVRDARLRLLADDVVTMREALAVELADEQLLHERRQRVESELASDQIRQTECEQHARLQEAQLASALSTAYRLSALGERFRGTENLATERARYLHSQAAPPRHGRDPEDLTAEAETIQTQQAEVRADVDRAQHMLDQLVSQRADYEVDLAAEENRLAAAARADADRREGLARLTGQVNALRSRAAAGEAEIGRLTQARVDAGARLGEAQRESDEIEARLAQFREDTAELDTAHQKAVAALAAAQERVVALTAIERQAEQERTALVARAEALELGLTDKDGAAALLAAADQPSGLRGAIATLLTVEPGAEVAVAAALGAAANAVAAATLEHAVAAVDWLKAQNAGKAGFLVGGMSAMDDRPWPTLPKSARYAIDVIAGAEELQPALRWLLRRVVVVADLAQARSLVQAHPELRAVTRDGDLLGTDFVWGGSAAAPSILEISAALDETRHKLRHASKRAESVREELADATGEQHVASERLAVALSRLRSSETALATVTEQFGQVSAVIQAASGEIERFDAAIAAAETARDAAKPAVADLEQRLAAAQAKPTEGELATEERDRLATACAAARHAEMEAQLTVRTGQERLRELAARVEALRAAAQAEHVARSRALASRERMTRQAAVAAAVADAARIAGQCLDASLAQATRQRSAAQRFRAMREAELTELRTRLRELSAELEQLVNSGHRDEVARAEQRLRIEQVEQKALEEFGLDIPSLLAEYGPDQPVPPDVPESGNEATAAEDADQPHRYVRAEQESRLKAATRELALLGKVNPLALEEFAALEERHTFLTQQVEDLKSTRRNLLTVVTEVDKRVEHLFVAAFTDTAREFEQVFAQLFPGGEGRLVLTDPSDVLMSGVEIEAQPPGKKVRRLSLLSGGERSLAAVALLIAIFRARPSPFYVLDEIEVALDDVNLRRLLDILAELRKSSQLIVITHQKRTMEIADALYGISMRDDGTTTVISQRLREPQPM